MKVLGINLSHNASFSIVEKGNLLLSIEQERVSRIKKDNQIDKLCEKLKGSHFEIIGYTSFDMTDERLESDTNYIKHTLKKYNISFNKLIPYDEHHLTHCYSSFYNSSFEEAICLIVDNGGTSFTFDGNKYGQEVISIYKLSYNHEPILIYKLCKNSWGKSMSSGKFYSENCLSPAGAFETYKDALGFREPGSIMGLSCYGKDNKKLPSLYENLDGFCKPNSFFNEMFLCREFTRFSNEDFCFRIQQDTTKVVKNYISWIMKNFGNNICLSGGFFQNSIANYEFLRLNNNIFVDPVCHDGGTSIGLAQHLDYTLGNNKPSKYKNLYQGPPYLNQEEELNIFKPPAIDINQNYKVIECDSKQVAKLLALNKCVGIYQGRSEMGPRALGNRSILFNPRDPNAKEKVNLVKNREWFRPYAGTVLHEHTKDWFDLEGKDETPYMSYVVKVKEDKINKIPGVCHIDNSCRIQTLKREQNVNFYSVIEEFYNITKIPVILNTSLNTAGMPLVESIEDLLNMMLKSNIDIIYLPEYGKALESA